MNRINVILFVFIIIHSVSGQNVTDLKTEYRIKEADLFVKFPNSNWDLANKEEGRLTQYIFKRKAITDNKERQIIPAVIICIEDASAYKQDVMLYSIERQKSFINMGVKIDTISIQSNAGYPLSYKNSCIYKCHYTDNETNHILYMIHIINKENKGIQIYLDMTQELAGEYEHEFIAVIKSIKEQKQKD
jgi:hypothetical protein